MKQLSIILLFILDILAKPCLSKSPVFDHFRLGKGLPARNIIQNHKGYIWIASDGLIQFNGIAIKRFIADPKNQNGLINNNIRSICEAPDGTLWLGTMNGISHYFPNKDIFTTYKRQAIFGNYNNIDNTVFVDEKGRIWCGNRYGIARFDEKQKKFYQYDLTKYQDKNHKDKNFITCIIQDKSDFAWLWLGTNHGFAHFRKTDGFTQYYDSKISVPINQLFMDSKNRLWIATVGQGIGLFLPEKDQTTYRLLEKNTSLDNTNIVTGICEKKITPKQSIFYFCTEKGLMVLDMGKEEDFQHNSFQLYAHSATNSKSIGGIPKDIMLDDQGIIWVTTDKDLSYILPANQFFTNQALPLGNINHITESSNEQNHPIYWISSWYDQGLAYVDSTFQKVVRVPYFDHLQLSNKSQQINNIVDLKSQIWVATSDGLLMYDKKNKKAFIFSKQDSLPENNITCICFDHKNKLLWVGTHSNGFCLFNPENHRVVSMPKSARLLTSGRINAIFEDSKNNIWLSDNDVLLRYSEEDFHPSYFEHQPGNLQSISSGTVTDITEDHHHRIWVATQQGLCLYHPTQNNFSLYTTTDGLSNNNIYSLASDDKDNLWIATAKGLGCMNTINFSIKTYYNDNGLNDDAELNYLLTTRSGKIIIGSKDLLTIFHPDNLIKNLSPPKVYINTLKLNNTPYRYIIDSNNSTFKLRYDQNYFTINFVALNYVNASDNRCVYQLQGVDKKFVNAADQRSVTYANVNPGRYIFNVKAANDDGIWNNVGARILIIITPPYWKTWWFYTLCLLMSFLSIYAIYHYHVAQLLKLERLRTKISTDLHDEIGSTLSAISILSSIAVNQKDKSNRIKMLEEIKENAAELMQKMDDIVWSINPKNDSLESLLWRIQTFAIRLFDVRNINYEIHITEDIASIKIPMDKRRHLYLILKESINNIIKHADCTFVKFKVHKDHQLLFLHIEDNGKGFDTSQLSYGNGLLSLQNRAKQIHANLSIHSEPSKGTTIDIRIKII